MFENIIKLFKKSNKKEALSSSSRDTAKERLHLVLMQDRANVSADFLDLMRQEIIEVIKKYIDIDESALDVRLKNQPNEDGTQGAPVLYANIPIINIKDENKRLKKELNKEDSSKEIEKEEDKSENKEASSIKEKKEDSNKTGKEEDSSKTEKKDHSSKKVDNKEKAKEINKKSPKTDKSKESEVREKNKIEAEKTEETKHEAKSVKETKLEAQTNEEELEKQEDEKIEEAKKIVEEEIKK